MNMVASVEEPRAVTRGVRAWAWLIVGLVLALASVGLVGVPANEASAATVDTSAWYVLVNRNSGKALDVYNLSTSDGGNVVQYDDWGGANQQWQLVRIN
jgi:hypothetical protein